MEILAHVVWGVSMDSEYGEQTGLEIVIASSDVLFECPSCGKSMVIDGVATGMMVECEQCRTNVIVPPKPDALGRGLRSEADDLLLLAAEQSDVDSLTDALLQGANANATKHDGTTALMLAAQHGAQDCIKLLIVHDANLDVTRTDGETAMTLAKRVGEFHILRMLWRAASKRRARRFTLRNRRK
jgi:predicted RNA-binding Zn-ribbon protein involved in translation (DUF1610 family)